MEHKQEECKCDDGEWHNEFPTESAPFIPHTAWTPEWKLSHNGKSDSEEETDSL